MSKKSHFNSGHIAMNQLKKNGRVHRSTVAGITVPYTIHGVFIQDAVDFLKTLPDSSPQLILIDPPYNLDLESVMNFGLEMVDSRHGTKSLSE
jgi:site-specific DNA-methyltransferase (adenine-specific)